MELAWGLLFTKYSEKQPSDGCVVLPPVGRMVSRNEFSDKLARPCAPTNVLPYSSFLSLKPLIGYAISFKARLYILCELVVISCWPRYMGNVSEEFRVTWLTRSSFHVTLSLLKLFCLISWKFKLYDGKLLTCFSELHGILVLWRHCLWLIVVSSLILLIGQENIFRIDNCSLNVLLLFSINQFTAVELIVYHSILRVTISSLHLQMAHLRFWIS